MHGAGNTHESAIQTIEPVLRFATLIPGHGRDVKGKAQLKVGFKIFGYYIWYFFLACERGSRFGRETGKDTTDAYAFGWIMATGKAMATNPVSRSQRRKTSIAD